MAKLTSTTIYGSANISGNVITTGPTFDISATNGLNFSSGNTITGVNFTNNGSGTGISGQPTIVFSNPTAFNGAVANANAVLRLSGSISIQNVGSGYANGDILYANSASQLNAFTIIVTSNTATTYGTGGINGFALASYGLYFSLPTYTGTAGAPILSLTGGKGTGANVQSFSGFAVNNLNFLSVGSGYTEVPTVTFSGNNSSSVIGYPYVGSVSKITALGNNLDLYTPGGRQVRISDTGAAVNFVQLYGAATGGGPAITFVGSDSAVVGVYGAQGAGAHLFTTNGNQQFRISDTASAVNYVQVTGAPTGLSYTQGLSITAQGSDTDVPLNIVSKNQGALRLISGGSGSGQITISGGTTGSGVPSAVFGTSSVAGNYWSFSGPQSSGNGPYIQTASSVGDTNIDFRFGSTGTGATRFFSGNLNGGRGYEQFRIADVTSGNAVNFLQVSGNTSNSGPVLSAQGANTNIDINITSKGTGNISHYAANSYFYGNVIVTGGMTVAGNTTIENVNITSISVNTTESIVTTGNITTGNVFIKNSITGNTSTITTDTLGNLILNPSANGAIQTNIGDGTTANGNIRGANAVDLQTVRNQNYQVASGFASVITGGNNNQSPGYRGFIGAGAYNNNSGSDSVVVGGYSNYTAVIDGVIGGGAYNNIPGGPDYSTIAGGFGNFYGISQNGQAPSGTQFGRGFIGGGVGSNIQGFYDVIGGGNKNITSNVAAQAVVSTTTYSNNVIYVSSTTGIQLGQGVTGTNISFDSWVTGINGNMVTLNNNTYASGTTTATFFNGSATIVGGQSNAANGSFSFVGGGGAPYGFNLNPQNFSGLGNMASGNYSAIVGGQANKTTGIYSFIGGGSYNSATAINSTVVGGELNTANGAFSFVGGGGGTVTADGNVAVAANSAIVGGQSNYINTGAQWGFIGGGKINSLGASAQYGVVVGGVNNSVSQYLGCIVGGTSNLNYGQYASMVGGFNNQVGYMGFVGGGQYNNAATTNSFGAVVGGYQNNAFGDWSFVGGGYRNFASGKYSAVLGGYQATTRGVTCAQAFGNSPWGSTQGTSQLGTYILSANTNSATANTMTSDWTYPASATNQVILPNNSAYIFKGSVVGTITGGGNTSMWTFEGGIKQGGSAGSTALVGTPIINLIAQDGGASAWSVAITADTTLGALKISVVGDPSATVRWVGRVDTTEVTF